MGNFACTMEVKQFCRICMKPNGIHSLFERSNRILLQQIKYITGLVLQHRKQLPTHICVNCHHDLQEAIKFRERCINSQNYFRTTKYKQKLEAFKNNELIEKKFSVDPTHAIVAVQSLNVTENNIKNREIVKYENDLAEEHIKMELEPTKDAYENNENGENLHMQYDGAEAENLIISADKSFIEVKNEPYSAKAITRKPTELSKNKQNIYICDQCGNNFKCRYHFQTHLNRHSGEKRFQCELCPDKFFTNSELSRHMRRHTGERPFACQYCDRRFSDYSTRRKHERAHTNERPFGCVHCKKAFTTSYILKNHMLTHTGERSFKCLLCDKSFQRQTHLVVHNRSIMHKHNEEKQLKEASLCEFITKSEMTTYK